MKIKIDTFLRKSDSYFKKSLYLKALLAINEALIYYPESSELLLRQAKLIQLQDSDTNGGLEKVRSIFVGLLERNPEDLQIHLEAFAFEYYVMDEEKRSSKILKAIRIIHSKQSKLYQDFLKDFKSEYGDPFSGD